jgi:ketosteroid isomerase-like protein
MRGFGPFLFFVLKCLWSEFVEMMQPSNETAMKQNNPLQLAQEFLRLMGSGAGAADIAKLFSENLEWEIAGDTGVLPWIGKKAGKSALFDFVNGLRSLTEPITFDVHDTLANDKRAVILGSVTTKLKRTGGIVKTEFAIILAVGNGEIVRFQMLEDSFAVSQWARG